MKQILRLIFCVFFVILICFCCSCGFFGDQKYTCDVDTVRSVQIISLNKYIEGEYRYEYTILCEIADQYEFIERLTSINHKVNWGEPSTLKSGYTVIKIDYLNGDYDLIYFNAQWMHRSGNNQTGYFFFDEEQFNDLISDYTSE